MSDLMFSECTAYGVSSIGTRQQDETDEGYAIVDSVIRPLPSISEPNESPTAAPIQLGDGMYGI